MKRGSHPFRSSHILCGGSSHIYVWGSSHIFVWFYLFQSVNVEDSSAAHPRCKAGMLVTLAGYCVHSTVVPAIVPEFVFAPSEEIDGKELLFSNGGGCYE